MAITIPKILSLVIALVYIALIIVNLGAKTAFSACIVLLLPLALIWFPDELGSMMGYVGRGNIDTETPSIVVSILGWFFLIGMPLILYFIFRSSG
jgi:hypothetical protein